jgi:hypothetical protein
MARKKHNDLTAPILPPDYADFLESLKARVRLAQTQAMLSVNRGLICLYWDIGQEIVHRQDRAGWGRSVVEQLADDIQRSFPRMGGFSRTNVFRMRALYLAYRSEVVPQPVGQTNRRKKIPQPVGQTKRSKVAQPVRQLAEAGPPDNVALLPWGHKVLLFERVKDQAERLWYAAEAPEHGWSRAVLTVQR